MKTAPRRRRLDQLLVERGLAESREQAQRLIRAGSVRAAGQVHTQPSRLLALDTALELEAPARYVGRGGEKLEAALRHFAVDVAGRVCLDVGASTGGFTDCLLQHGAARVYALDVGRGQLHWKLRKDARVVAIEGVNARYLRAGDLPETPTLATVDVSFISLEKILPAVAEILAPGADLITLIKPQFEAGRHEVRRGGVVRDSAVHEAVVARVKGFGVETLGLDWRGVCESPVRGPAGNVEFLAYWRRL